MVGDVLLSSILCQHLKIHFPGSQVHYLINENTVPVVEGNPYIDKFIIFSPSLRKNKLAFYKFLKSISKEKYDTVIDVYCKLESNLISLFCNASMKLSYRKWYSSFVYDQLLIRSRDENGPMGMAVQNRLELLNPIIPKLKFSYLEPKIYLSETEIREIKLMLTKRGVCSDKPIFMIGIQGSCPSKSYPLNYLAHIIDALSENFDATILFNYLPNQKDKLIELLDLCSENSRKSIMADIFCPDLRSFIALLSRCDGYIGNEGGASNISKALGVPNYSIFSPWISKKAWLTFKDNTANQGVHLEDYIPEIGKMDKKARKENVHNLYQQFHPELFIQHLLDFVQFQILSNQ